MSEKRITPEEVSEAYERTGLRPAHYDINPWQGGCCGLGVVTVATVGKKRGYSWVEEVYGEEYVGGYIAGFDGFTPLSESERARQGFEDGRAAAARVFGDDAR